MPQVQELTVGLRFTADTQAARQQLNTLKQDLNNLATLKNINIGDGLSESLQKASNAAAQLKVQLQEATSVKTGNLDLTKFNYSLKQSGMTLEQYKQQLFMLGADGQKAFFQLASSIQSAEIPLLRINKLFNGLWDNLKRTAGWQFSSTAIHAVIGAVQKAYDYAQDLNRSLNDIRIVTGQSADQMAHFAEVANKAAKALSTSTNEYVKASLIYYQQGLSDSEVQARTDVTVKMANVTRESAETVSDQMTAVWNNFAKGGENLESFADKMVALGAATASSSDEIAHGLEKFAAVADTVGLSFDYAAAALTTITATTRQSADTVGTALKTLFARMEGLKLGETLEDGTDLNKYSEALASVGVNIKDANGEIKQMDTILDETMSKWKTLSKDQQIALAQTVAGVRQYTQFVALMDNADFFKENLATEAGSSGALQEQADIYAESWEAAQKRVKAASESIYSDLLDDKFFIKLTNNFAKLIEGIDKFIDSLGGLKGLLPGIAALILKIGGDKIAANIERSANSFKTLISGGAAEKALKNEAANIGFNENKDSASYAEQAQGTYYVNIQKAQSELTKYASKMSDAELRINEIYMDRLKVLNQINVDRAKEYEAAEKQERVEKRDLHVLQKQGIDNINKSNIDDIGAGIVKDYDKLDFSHLASEAEIYQEKLNLINKALAEQEQAFTTTAQSVGNFDACYDELISAIQQYNNAQNSGSEEAKAEAADRLKKAYEELASAGQKLDRDIQLEPTYEELEKNTNKVDELTASYDKISTSGMAKMNQQGEKLAASYTKMGIASDKAQKKVDSLGYSITQKAKASAASAKAENIATKATDKYVKSLTKAKAQVSSFGKSIVTAARTISQVMMAVNSLSSAVQTLSDPDMSTWDKFTSVLMSVSFAIPGVIAGFSSLGTVLKNIHKLPEMISSGFNLFKTGLESINGLLISQNSLYASFATHISAWKAGMDAATFSEIKNNAVKTLSLNLDERSNKLAAYKLIKQQLVNKGLVDSTGKIAAETMAKLTNGTVTESMSLAEGAFATVKAISTGATNAGTVANVLYETSLAPILILVLALVAGFALLAVGIYAIVKAFNAQNDELNMVNQALEQQRKITEDLKNKYDQLSDSISKLNSANETIKELDTTSKDWAKTVAEINDQILELIKLYPELSNYVIMTNGYLNLNEDGYIRLAQLQEEALADYQKSNFAELALEIRKSEIEYNNAKKKHYSTSEYSGLTPEEEEQIANLRAKNQKLAQSSNKNRSKMTQNANAITTIEASAKTRIAPLSDKLVHKLSHLSKQDVSAIFANQELFDKYIDGLSNLNEVEKELAKKYYAQGDFAKNLQADADKLRNINNQTDILLQEIGYNTILDTYGTAIDTILTADIQELNGPIAETEDQLNKYRQQFATIITKTLSDDLKTQYEAVLDEFNAAYQKGNKKAWGNQELEDYLNKTGFKGKTDWKIDTDTDLGKLYLQYVEGDENADNYEYFNNNNQISYNKDKSKKKSEAELIGTNDKVNRETIARMAMSEELAERIGTDMNNDKVAEIANSLVQVVAQGEQLGRELGANFTDGILTSLSSGEFNLESTILEMNLGEFEKLKEKSATELANLFNIDQINDPAIWEKLGYENAEAWGEAFKSELNNYTEEEILKHQLDQINKDAEEEGLGGEDAANYAQTLMDIAADEAYDKGNQLADTMEKDARAAGEVAKSVMRMNDGIEELAKNQEDWLSVLNSSSASSEEFSQALNGIRKAMSKILNIDGSYLSKEFLTNTENLELMKKAAEGDAEAIDALKAKLADEVILKIIADNEIENKDALLAQHADLQKQLTDLKVGATLKTDSFLAAAQSMIDAAGMTVEQAQAYFNSLGYEPDITPIEVEQPQEVAETVITPQVHFKGFSLNGVGEALKAMFNGGSIELPSITYQSTSHQVPAGETITRLASIGTTKKTSKPKINGVTKLATGSMNNYSSSNPGGKSSGGGGGGSGKDKTSKKASDETERYHEINEQLDDMSHKLDQITTAKDRAFGAKHIAAIDAEIAALEEESKLLDQKLKETKEYFDQDAAALNAYGAIYDSAGRITNYNKIIENAVTNYNAGSIDDEEYEHIKDALSKYEESLNQMEDLTEERAENARKILDAQFEKVEYSIEVKLKISDETNKILDWQMSQLEDQKFASVERINLFDQQVAAANARWMSYMGGINDILKAAGATQEQIEQYLSGDVEAIANLDNLTQQAIDDLGEYVDGLREEQLKLLELQRSIYEELNNLQDEYNTKFENMLSNYEDASTELEFLQNAIDTMGKKTAGISNDLLSSLRRGQIEIQYGNIKSLQSQLAMNEVFLKETQEKLKIATDNERAQLEEMEQTLLDKVSDIKGNIYSEANELMEGLKEDFEANIDAMFEEFEKELSGVFDSFEELRDQFDQAQTLREEYIPEYQKLYELSKLTRQLNKDISETDNIKGKQKLRELQEEIIALQADGVELSEYDLKNMQNKYDLRLAEIALEEAQNSKGNVRLTRDSMGNYSYVYTANEKNIDEAEQKYEDALYKMQDENEKYLTELSDLYLQIQTEMVEKLTDAAKTKPEQIGMISDYYTQRLNYIEKQMNNALGNNGDLYNNDLKAYKDSLRGKIIENKAFTRDFKSTLLGGVLDTYNSLDEYNQDFLSKLGSPSSGTGLLGQVSNSIAELNASYETILSQVTGSTVKLGETIGTIYNANGQAVTSFADLAKNSLTDVLEETQGTMDKTKEFGEAAKVGYQKAANEVSKASSEIIQKLNQMTAETVKAQLAHELLLKTLERKIVDPNNVVTNTVVNVTKNISEFQSSSSNDGASGGGGTSGGGGFKNVDLNIQKEEEKKKVQPETSPGTYKGLLSPILDTRPWTKKQWRHNNFYHWKLYDDGTEDTKKEKHQWVASGTNNFIRAKCTICNFYSNMHQYTFDEKANQLQHGGIYQDRTFGQMSYYLTNQKGTAPWLYNGNMRVATFNKGGYTGAWGSEGKLAMLHEKELILNKQDTQNMLATVDFVRSLSSMIDLQGLARSFGQLATLPQVANNLSNSNSNVNQEIHIDASFPGVTAREEIEQAFSDLALQAAQYINKY